DEDNGTADGIVSLREAVASSLSVNSYITFHPSLHGGTIRLNGALNLPSSTSITGPGADLLTIAGNGAGSVFTINNGNASTFTNVTISGITVSGGNSTNVGGGISSVENLTLDSVKLTN